MISDRRLGIFSISMPCIDITRDAVRQVMGACIIVRAECLYAEDRILYTAISPHFDLLPEGEMIPQYEWVMSKTEPLGIIGIKARRSDRRLTEAA
jgi:hypothetical protein